MSPQAWLFPLDLPASELPRLAGLLAPEERARAAAIRHAVDRGRFVARRGQLRLLLEQATGQRAAAIGIATTPQGKPYLAGAGPRFSVSSAGGFGLCVLADEAVGCDLALEDPDLPALAIACHLFSAAEHRGLAAAAEDRRNAAFLKLWTRKEAVVKALGTGLEIAPDLVAVGAPEVARAEVQLGGSRWQVADMPAPMGYAAALCLPHGSMPDQLPAAAIFDGV